jgi:hypothetical protein
MRSSARELEERDLLADLLSAEPDVGPLTAFYRSPRRSGSRLQRKTLTASYFWLIDHRIQIQQTSSGASVRVVALKPAKILIIALSNLRLNSF